MGCLSWRKQINAVKALVATCLDPELSSAMLLSQNYHVIPGRNTLKQSISLPLSRTAADGKVLQVSPSLQPSLQIQDPLLAMAVVDNSLQELASSVSQGHTGSRGRPELIRHSDGRLHHPVTQYACCTTYMTML